MLRVEGDLGASAVAVTQRHVTTKNIGTSHLHVRQMSTMFRNLRQAKLPDVFGRGLGKVDHRQLDS